MNEKLNIQDLIDTLAERHGMSKRNADSFVKEFFQLIEESLETDKYVKIRGLGTFKLIDVGSRESVNVNTGERFEIQGHTKVSFTPEPALKDVINKPFSHFETVALNDTTVLEDTLQENDSEDDEDIETKTSEQEAEEKVEPAIEEKKAIAADEVAVKEAVTGEVALAEEAAIEETLAETVTEEPTAGAEPEIEEEKPEIEEKIASAADEVAVKEAATEEVALAEEAVKGETLAETVTEESTAGAGPEVEEEKPEVKEEKIEVEKEKPEVEEEKTEIEKEQPRKNELEAMPENRVATGPEPSEPAVKDMADSSAMKYFIGIVVFVVLLCGGAVAFMYYPDLLGELTAKPLADSDVKKSGIEKGSVPADKDNASLTDSIVSKDVVIPARTDTVAKTVAATTPALEEAPKESVQAQSTAPTKEPKKRAAPFEPDSVEYTIVGTETTYTIKEGETLTRVALRFYGTKALWPYIVKHNPRVIKNPDNVPYGTTIKIPKLAKKQ